jgi:hypothetical protein
VSSPGAPVSVPPAFREPSSSLCQEKHQRGKQVSRTGRSDSSHPHTQAVLTLAKSLCLLETEQRGGLAPIWWCRNAFGTLQVSSFV